MRALPIFHKMSFTPGEATSGKSQMCLQAIVHANLLHGASSMYMRDWAGNAVW